MVSVKMLKNYADFIIDVGLKTTTRQSVLIYADVEMANFVRYLVGELYKARVRRVSVHYTDQSIARMWLINTPETRIVSAAQQFSDEIAHAGASGQALIFLTSCTMDSRKRFPADKLAILRKALNDNIVSFEPYLSDKVKHIEAIVPTRNWAADCFPDMTPSQATNRMWELIFDTLGIDLDNQSNPQMKNERANRMAEVINRCNISQLKITSRTTGTNCTISLPLRSMWHSALRTEESSGDKFFSQTPAFGVYTAPHSHGIDGVIVASRPIYLREKKIEGARLTFKDGEIVKATADTEGDTLADVIGSDSSIARAGYFSFGYPDWKKRQALAGYGSELLDFISPIVLSLGQAPRDSVIGSDMMDIAERVTHGLNQSIRKIPLPLYADDIDVIGVSTDSSGKKTEHVLVKAGEPTIFESIFSSAK